MLLVQQYSVENCRLSISRAHMCMPRLNANWRRGTLRLARSLCAQPCNDLPRRTITIRYSCVMSDFRRSSVGVSATYATPRARERIWASGTITPAAWPPGSSSYKTAGSYDLCDTDPTERSQGRAACYKRDLEPLSWICHAVTLTFSRSDSMSAFFLTAWPRFLHDRTCGHDEVLMQPVWMFFNFAHHRADKLRIT